MFKWTYLEWENIAESKTGLHLSLRGLDVEIIAFKVPAKQIEIAIRFPCFLLVNNVSEIHGKRSIFDWGRFRAMKYVDHF